MSNKVYSQLMGIVTRVQNYPGLNGLEQIKTKVSRICQENNCSCPKSIELFLNAYTFDRKDNIKSAIVAYKLCLSLLTDDELPLRIYINALLASMYIDAENYTTAYILYKEVLENIQLLDDNIRSLIYCNISDMYLCLAQYEQAIEYAKQGVTAAKNSNNLQNKAISLLNIGYAYGHLSQFKKAINVIHRAKNIAKKNHSSRIIALSYGYLAQILAKQPNASQKLVIEYFKKAEEFYSDTQDKHNQLENSIFFAQYLESINHNDDAVLLCEDIEKKLQSTNNYGFYSVYAHVQANLIEKQQQWPQLISHQKLHIQKAEKTLDVLKQLQNKALIKNVDVIEDNQQQQVLSNMQEHMGAITEIGQYIATTLDLTASLTDILTKINSILPTFEFGIALYDKETHDLDYRYFIDANGPVPLLTINCQQHKTVGTYVIKNRATVHLNTVTDDALAPFVDNEQRKKNDMVVRKNSPAVHSIILTPIILKDDVLGLLSVQHHNANQYHEHHRHLIEHLASFIAVSLENQKQRQRLEDANKNLDLLSKTDPLTGLYNRYQLDKITPKLVEQALKENTNIAVLMLDLDDYKTYNDTYGHIEGDNILNVISQLMRNAFSGSNDYLFRYGGDEFLIISFDHTSNTVETKIRRLRDSLHQANVPNPKSRYSDRLSVSIGGINTQLNQTSSIKNFSQLSHIADKQLYKVKKAGRNNYLLI
ncbi:diguanylate cyclase [Aliivibrio sp. S3MY1]|uniref:diguanylate cyclase n=1 Tax=unclassified Aliivibrio TaxID=2645654 RepID=UPI002378A499|nr:MULTISPECIES: diguanylate cyclase [unclassified Aliivibrio]MDD9196990.1 diguanylate cyclase [Aliivibrio sp. S3MY1]MDD9198096.1 diguanylate cyclase [Aliivibrio sp. S2MY1]